LGLFEALHRIPFFALVTRDRRWAAIEGLAAALSMRGDAAHCARVVTLTSISAPPNTMRASGTLVPANCSLKAPNLLQKLRESVKARDTSGEHRAEAFMGEVIEGPWRRRGGPDLMRALSEEIARMTAALERLRELHKRGEALKLQGEADAGAK
jgi:hypothetical protein